PVELGDVADSRAAARQRREIVFASNSIRAQRAKPGDDDSMAVVVHIAQFVVRMITHCLALALLVKPVPTVADHNEVEAACHPDDGVATLAPPPFDALLPHP